MNSTLGTLECSNFSNNYGQTVQLWSLQFKVTYFRFHARLAMLGKGTIPCVLWDVFYQDPVTPFNLKEERKV